MQSKTMRWLAYGLVLADAAIELFGGLYYDATPSFVWSLGDGILMFLPLVYGMGMGLVGLIPVTVAEIIWALSLHAWGPIFHLVAFTVLVVTLGLFHKRLVNEPRACRVILSVILFLASLICEEIIFRGLFFLFLNRPIAWDKIFTTALSPVNILLACLLAFCLLRDASPNDGVPQNS